MNVVGLVRGVNVGGKNPLKMADLSEALTRCACDNVQTLLQSGNFVCETETKPHILEGKLQDELRKKAGIDVECVVRSAADWNTIIANNPFGAHAETDPSHILVYVSNQDLEEEWMDDIRAAHPGPEEIALIGQALYVTYPDGIAESLLARVKPWRQISNIATGRNWNTVCKLAQMAE